MNSYIKIKSKSITLALAKLFHDSYQKFFCFRKWVDHVNSPVLFCHNDLQGGNILLRHDLGDSGIAIGLNLVP